MFFVIWLLALSCWLIGIATYFLVENASFCYFVGSEESFLVVYG
jgi:hypothetical protein